MTRVVIEPGATPGPREHGVWVKLTWEQLDVLRKAGMDALLRPVVRRSKDYTIHEIDDLSDALAELDNAQSLRPPS